MTSPAALFAKALVPALVLFGTAAGAQEWHTTSSLMGESKYGEDFKHYDYVNPDAPKGGTLNSVAAGTFDSFNPYIVRGSPAAGAVAPAPARCGRPRRRTGACGRSTTGRVKRPSS